MKKKIPFPKLVIIGPASIAVEPAGLLFKPVRFSPAARAIAYRMVESYNEREELLGLLTQFYLRDELKFTCGPTLVAACNEFTDSDDDTCRHTRARDLLRKTGVI